MTMTRPCRLITLQLSHIVLTLARTFMFSVLSKLFLDAGDEGLRFLGVRTAFHSERLLRSNRASQLLVAVRDPTSFEIVRSELHLDTIARQDSDVVHAHLSRNMCQNFMAILEFDPKHGIGKGLSNCPLQYDCVFFWLCQRNFLLIVLT